MYVLNGAGLLRVSKDLVKTIKNVPDISHIKAEQRKPSNFTHVLFFHQLSKVRFKGK